MQENDVVVVEGKLNLRPGVKVVERPKENKEPGKEGAGKPDAAAGTPAANAQPAAPASATAPAAAPAAAAPAAK